MREGYAYAIALGVSGEALNERDRGSGSFVPAVIAQFGERSVSHIAAATCAGSRSTTNAVIPGADGNPGFRSCNVHVLRDYRHAS